MNSLKLFYRAEIDGLRAIAVVSVILYHAQTVFFGKDWFEGGFIGVDIFFVISGFLITRVILSELQSTGSFGFLNFYERRARRILPMLYTPRLDHSFERGLDNVSAEYSLREDGGIKVLNQGLSIDKNEWNRAEGKAYFVDSNDIAHLKVSFFGPFYASYIVFGQGRGRQDRLRAKMGRKLKMLSA